MPEPGQRGNPTGVTFFSGEALQEIREAAEMSREELAYKAGVSFHSIYSWEVERINPRVDSIKALARVLGVKPSELFRPDAQVDAQAHAMFGSGNGKRARNGKRT